LLPLPHPASADIAAQRAVSTAAHMRLWSWLKSLLEKLRTAFAGYRTNPRALIFFAGCALVFSGVYSWSPAAARVVLGSILIVAILWPDRRKESQ
jgi:hypothetical protein